MMSRPPSQPNNNTLIDLFVRIKDLLKEGRTDVVHNVAKKSDMNPHLQTCFAELADLVIAKNEEIEERAMINRFYRDFIIKIKEKEPITEDILRNQYSFIGEDVQDMLLELVLYIRSLENQVNISEEQNQQMRKEREQIEMRLQSQKSELQAYVNQIRNAQEDEKMEHDQEKRELLQTINQLKYQSEKQIKESMIMVEKKSQENSTWQKKLQEKEAQCVSYVSQIQTLNQKLQSLQKELNEKIEVSISQWNMSQELSLRYKEKQEQVEALKSRIQGNQKNYKIAASSRLLIESSIFLDASNLKYQLPYSLLSALENLNGEINSIQKLYTFSFQKKASFHQFIDSRQNILIVCSTIDGRIIGGFTTAKFSLRQKVDTKAFLFGISRDQISVNYLKPGRESIIYDVDFIVFGNEQLCIQKGNDELTSFYPHAQQSSRHYKSPSREDYFLDILGDNGKVMLKNYQIFQIHFKQ